MKRYFAAILALIAILSCSKITENDISSLEHPSDITPAGRGELKVSARIDTKTEMASGGLEMAFVDGDKIALTLVDSELRADEVPFTAYGADGSGCDFLQPESISITVNEGATAYAYYPFDKFVDDVTPSVGINDWVEVKSADWSGTKTFTIPPEQEQLSSGDFSNLRKYIYLAAKPATVENSAVTLRFSPVSAQVRVKLTNSTGESITVDYVTLSGDGVCSLSGVFSFDLTADPSVANSGYSLTEIAGEPSVKLSLMTPAVLPDGASADLYFVTAPCESANMTLSVHTTSGGTLEAVKYFDNAKQQFTRALRRHLGFTLRPAAGGNYHTLDVPVHEEGAMYDTYEGLVMAGYQGWHGCPGDGRSGWGDTEMWYQYAFYNQFNGVMGPGPLHSKIDFWPYMDEYTNTYNTNFKYSDNTTAAVYSSMDYQTVDTHFKWMKQYGIDGVFMQRFASMIGYEMPKKFNDRVLDNAMTASNKYDRAIAVMYDMVGLKADNGNTTPAVSVILDDAAALLERYHLNDRSAGQRYYLYHNGKPLIGLVSACQINMPYDKNDAISIINGLKALGYSVMVGLPTYWREGGTDCPSQVTDVAALADVVMPWFVGRYDYDGSILGSSYSFDNFTGLIDGDIAWCNANGVDYAPNCWPGFRWENSHPQSKIFPRKGGDFLWKQIYYDITAGADMIYIAMFDEINEGTAIYKCLEESDVPGNTPSESYYVKYENGTYTVQDNDESWLWHVTAGSNKWCKKASEIAVPLGGIEDGLGEDYYLWLTGQARRMLRGEIPISATKPTK